MTFERIPSPSHPLYADAMVLYGISFPAHEQRETPSQTAILTHPDYHFTAILDGSHFVGDMLYWETPDFRYIEHFYDTGRSDITFCDSSIKAVPA